MQLGEVVDVEFAVSNIFEKGSVHPRPSGENVLPRRRGFITWLSCRAARSCEPVTIGIGLSHAGIHVLSHFIQQRRNIVELMSVRLKSNIEFGQLSRNISLMCFESAGDMFGESCRVGEGNSRRRRVWIIVSRTSRCSAGARGEAFWGKNGRSRLSFRRHSWANICRRRRSVDVCKKLKDMEWPRVCNANVRR